MNTGSLSANSAATIYCFLKPRGVDRVFALCGGYIMPIWMRVDAEGIAIVDVRDERAAVSMAHASGLLASLICSRSRGGTRLSGNGETRESASMRYRADPRPVRRITGHQTC
ncbi:MAG TPA: thiamine pyrophosphate-binding protein [Casimicrobiaceae bacterium]|nr:thiamine pyrophosphate-binding protein [Casimicrobiaceae bacterium]